PGHDRSAFLHQLGRVAFHSSRKTARRRLRSVPAALRKEKIIAGLAIFQPNQIRVWPRIMYETLMNEGLRLVKSKDTQTDQRNFHRAPNSPSFKALVAFDLVARLARRGGSDGGISYLQQHSGGEKEGRQL